MRFNQGKGPLIIAKELKSKGIINYDLTKYDWYAKALTVKIKKYGQNTPKDYKEKAKQMRFLQSRGFNFDEINYAMQ